MLYVTEGCYRVSSVIQNSDWEQSLKVYIKIINTI